MRKLSVLVLSVVLLITLSIVGCSQGSTTQPPAQTSSAAPTTSQPAAKMVEVTVAEEDVPMSVFVSGVMQPWATEIEKAAPGKIKFNHNAAAALGPLNEHFNLVVQGIAQASYQNFLFTPGVFLSGEVAELPSIGIKSGLASNFVMRDMFAANKSVQDEFKAAKVLFWTGGPGRNLHTIKPVKTLEDLKGLRIATFGYYNTKAMQLLGATPIAMDPSEVYLSLQKGILDGVMIINEGVMAFKYNDIAKNTINLGLSPFSGVAVINNDFFNKLPADLQKTVTDVSATWSEKAGKAVDGANAGAGDAMKQMGQTFSTLTPDEQARWYKLLEPMTAEWIGKAKAKGMPAEDLIKQYTEAAKKY